MAEEPVHSVSVDCECPSEEMEIRQGDILIQYSIGRPVPSKLHAVINADCDLAQDKTGGHIAMLKIVPFREYVRVNWAQRKLKRSLDRKIDQLASSIEKGRVQKDPAVLPISREALVDWLKKATSLEIAKSVYDDDGPKLRLHKLVEGTKLAMECAEDMASDPFSRLARMRCVETGGASQTEIAKLTQSAAQELARLPDDVFFIAEIPGIQGMGHAVLLRSMVTADLACVTTKFSDAKMLLPEAHCRIARLKPAYKYGLAQQFSLMYARIGLPDDHSAAHHLVLETLSSTLDEKK